MTQDYTTRAALQDDVDEELESLRAAMYDQLQGHANHTHSWVPKAGKDRFIGGVWQYPYECGCGATAWKQRRDNTFWFVDIQKPFPAAMIQNDIWSTPLPNGMLRWFGFDFDNADLPDKALLHRGDRPQWTGTLPGFTHKTSISDAKVIIEVDEFELDADSIEYDNTTVLPKSYNVTIDAHGLNQTEAFSCSSWQEVQHRCRHIEQQLDESRHERHARCQDEQGNLTAETCSFCERGQ